MTDENGNKSQVLPFDRAAHMRSIQGKGAEARKAASDKAGPIPDDYETRWNRLLAGDLKVTDLDDEELARMRTRSRLGDFSGRPSKNIPRKLEQEMRAEFLKRQQQGLEDALPIALKALSDVANKGIGRDRIAAAQILLERAMGKVAQTVDVTQHSADPIQDVVEGIISEAYSIPVESVRQERASG